MKNMRNIVFIVMITASAVLLMLCVGPIDSFTHGNYCDAVDYSDIDQEDRLGYVDLGKDVFEGGFMPAKKHFVGLALCLVNVPQDAGGTITVLVTDSAGSVLAEEKISLNEVTAEKWHRVYLDADLRVGSKYVYTISAQGCDEYPGLPIVDEDYLGEESIDREILIGYIYADSTFSFAEKLLIEMLILAVWLLCISRFLTRANGRKIVDKTAFLLLMIAGMSWNFMLNSLDVRNDSFSKFQADSETLVTGIIYADQNALGIDRYGLGRYTDLRGTHKANHMSFLTDSNWLCGYSRMQPQIMVGNTKLSRKAAMPGNYIRFSNGDIFRILDQEQSGSNLIISLEAKKALNYYKYGDLLDAQFLDPGMRLLKTREINSYKSQYGLQGKVLKHMARCLDLEDVIQVFNVICCILTAVVFTGIVILINKKYNTLMAGCFYGVFLLSPWVVNFARNLYWLEFTWFVPMFVGLFCSLHRDNRGYRIISYDAAFAAVFVKCLCGYEYITTVMMGLVVFLLADLCVSFMNGNKKQSADICKTIFILGMAAIAGFIAALCMHANFRGEGDIIEGIKEIVTNDVLRRTFGGDLNSFDERYWASFNASMWEVFRTYFHFKTEVVTGVGGNLFPAICIVPVLILLYDHRKNQMDRREAVLYVCCFVTSISWYLLGKQHSYIHTHMNYVLWYFGYVQICFYIILRRITKGLRRTGKQDEAL